ncbi:MAG: ester cyclase [Thermomicrobiales bacterium]|nr:ester cyclase [Thermomicrobiales bacterium]
MLRIILLVVLFACSVLAPGRLWPAPLATAQEATPEVACEPSSEADNTALVHRWNATISAGGAAALGEFLAPEVVRHGGGTIPDSLGRADVVRNFALYFAAIPDLQSTIQQTVADDDLVAVRVTEQGTQERDLPGVPASGNAGVWTIFTIYRFECGKIAEYWSQLDDLGRLQQFGVLPQMAPVAAAATPAAATVVAASPTVCAETTPEESEALVRRWCREVYQQRNFAGFDEIIAPNHICHGLRLRRNRRRFLTLTCRSTSSSPNVTWPFRTGPPPGLTLAHGKPSPQPAMS